jgi:hypothetical protein
MLSAAKAIRTADLGAEQPFMTASDRPLTDSPMEVQLARSCCRLDPHTEVPGGAAFGMSSHMNS